MEKIVIREPEKLIATEKDIINLAKKINEIIDFLNSKYPTIKPYPNGIEQSQGTGKPEIINN